MRLESFHVPVVLDLTRLGGSVEPETRRCCERLGAHPIDWHSDTNEPLPESAAVVSALRWGERVIPAALLAPLEALSRRVPLLLLSAEPLVAPAVTLHDGLVVLVRERPVGRVYGELRLLLLRAASASRGALVSGALLDERCSAGLWCASVSASLYQQGESLFALLPLEERLAGGEVVARLASVVGSESAPSAALAARLGTRAGLVGVSADAHEWLIYWPSSVSPLWFCSPLRLPEVVRIGGVPGDGDPSVLRFPAAIGDAVLALARSPGPELAPPSAAEGAPAWLDRALAARAAGPDTGALAIEVRP